MKINLLLPLALLLAIIPLSGAQATHGGTGASDAPLPIQACFMEIQRYSELFLSRSAGLTLEESLSYNDMAVRILRYQTDQLGIGIDEDAVAEVHAMTIETYGLREDVFFDIDWQIAWATLKFDECVAAIPRPEPDSNQQERMMPEIET